MRMTFMFAILVLALSQTPANAKDHSAEYQTGKLISWEMTSVGQNCNPGVLGGVHCEKKTKPAYTVRVADNLYVLRIYFLSDADWNFDALQGLAPGTEVRVRFEKGNGFVPYTNKRGKNLEAEYKIVSVQAAH